MTPSVVQLEKEALKFIYVFLHDVKGLTVNFNEAIKNKFHES